MTAATDRTADLRDRYAEAIRHSWSALPDFEMDALLRVVMHVRDAEVDRLTNQVADQQRQIECIEADRVRLWEANKRAQAARLAAEQTVGKVETVKCWTNEDGKRFVFVTDLQQALGVPQEQGDDRG